MRGPFVKKSISLFLLDLTGAWRFQIVLLSLWTTVVYAPSLLHVARSDHLLYLMETAQIHDWPTLGLKLFAFTRQRTMVEGDMLLFRPLFYSMMGTEKWLFGHHFIRWQVVGVLLHLAILFWLLGILRSLGLRRSALMLVLFFASIPLGMDMVIWHHLHGYLFFIWMVLIAFHEACRMSKTSTRSMRSLSVMAISLTLATFTYEAGFLFTLLFAVFVGCHRTSSHSVASRMRASLLLALPALAYVGWDVMDFLGRVHAPEANRILSTFRPLKTFTSMGVAGFWWIYGGMTASQLPFVGTIASRLGISSESPLFPILNPPWHLQEILLHLFFAILLCACLWILASTMTTEHLRKRWPLLALTLGMMGIYLLLIVVGRTNARGVEPVLKNNIYYSYPFWALVILTVGLIGNAKRSHNIHPWLRNGTLLLLLGLALWNSHVIWTINRGMAHQHAPVRQLIQQVDAFVQQHPEPDLSFEIGSNVEGNSTLFQVQEGSVSKGVTMIDILYPQYSKKRGATYFFDGKTWTPKS